MILALLLATATAPAAKAPIAPPTAEAAEAQAAVQQSRALWAIGGNLRLKSGDAATAVKDFDRGLAIPGGSPIERGELLLDRARAAQATGDLKGARASVRAAAPLIAGDPFLWYFSAALALQENDMPTARLAIDHALRLAPGDATLLLEAGAIAAADGQDAVAREHWAKAAAADPNGASGAAARRSLGATQVPLTITSKVTSVQPD